MTENRQFNNSNQASVSWHQIYGMIGRHDKPHDYEKNKSCSSEINELSTIQFNSNQASVSSIFSKNTPYFFKQVRGHAVRFDRE